jgi:hypothetical protein
MVVAVGARKSVGRVLWSAVCAAVCCAVLVGPTDIGTVVWVPAHCEDSTDVGCGAADRAAAAAAARGRGRGWQEASVVWEGR